MPCCQPSPSALKCSITSWDRRINVFTFVGERSGGQAGRGPENKVPFVAAVSLNGDGRVLRTIPRLRYGAQLAGVAVR